MRREYFKRIKIGSLISLVVFTTGTLAQISELPVIDGNGSDAIWSSANTFTIESAIRINSISDENDFSGTAKVLWSSDSIYYLIEVKDDILYDESTNHWENDNFVLYLDLYNQKSPQYLDESQMYWEIYWYNKSHAGRTGTTWSAPPANIAKTIHEGTNYIAEVAIPLNFAGFSPAINDTIGFEVKINDNDGEGATAATGRNILSLHDLTDLSWNQPWVFSAIKLNGAGAVDEIETPMIIDGDLDASLAYINRTQTIATRITSINNYRNFSGMTKGKWNSDGLYLYLSVEDAVLYSGSASHDENDNFVLILDLYNKKTETYVDSTQMYWEFYWYEKEHTGSVGDSMEPNAIEFARKVSEAEKKFTAEIFIPWDSVGFTPETGDTLGFDILITDNDGDGVSVLSWYDSVGNVRMNLSTLGTIILDEYDNIYWFSEPAHGGECQGRDSLLIAYMGSSVAYGTGATNDEGYTFHYSELLEQRAESGIGGDFYTENISIGGNSTINVLDRWDNDLLPLCSGYVMYGLSLGNEGIHEQGQPMFSQFRDNMLVLIDQSRENGIEPVVVNCYTRSDFNSTDYDYIKQMNLLIHSWDVASINVLGAIDDGFGRWASGYMNDAYHPNTEGHLEFFYSMVPSLFDALNIGKPQPEKVEDTYLTIDKPASIYQLELTPEGTIHPFTFSFDIRTASVGTIAGFETDTYYGALIIDETTGNLLYHSPVSEGIRGISAVSDNEWHKITLTHYYARGKTYVYVDGIEQGSVSEKLLAKKFFISSIDAPSADYREWQFYRSAMNQVEINAMVKDSLLKSSLELYAPLDGQHLTELHQLDNLAQSMNTIEEVENYDFPLALHQQVHNESGNLSVYPNPISRDTKVGFSLVETADVKLSIVDISGRTIATWIDESIPEGIYSYYLHELNQVDLFHGSLYFLLMEIDAVKYVERLMVLD